MILDRNPLTVNPKELKDIQVLETIKAGKSIFMKEIENEIVNKYWKLKTLEGQAVIMTESQEREQFFMLKIDGTFSGFGACNSFKGQYHLEEGNRIRFNENIAVTMMHCGDLSEKEAEFLEVLKLTDNYTINGDVLSLNIGRRAPLATFEAVYFK